MAELRGTHRHLIDRRTVRAADSCGDLHGLPGGSTSCWGRLTSVAALLMVAGGCGGAAPAGPSTAPPPPPPKDATHSALADEDTYQPPYSKPELQKALSAERVLEVTAERKVNELEDLLARQPDTALADQLHAALAVTSSTRSALRAFCSSGLLYGG